MQWIAILIYLYRLVSLIAIYHATIGALLLIIVQMEISERVCKILETVDNESNV